jgi:CRISPR-associated protein Cas1
MFFRTLYFGNPARLRMTDEQLSIERDAMELVTIPIEDIGILILDHPQITLSHALMQALLENNVVMVSCDFKHHPAGLLVPMEGHTLQSERMQAQIEASQPLKKRLWQHTVRSKILNQSILLSNMGVTIENMHYWMQSVKSGDSENHEARAAAYYWGNIFPEKPDFRRERFGAPPNSLLNYGYAIIRACMARALVASGLHPTIGIFHKNKYNAYCLADDIMEPFRPFCDWVVLKITKEHGLDTELNPSVKRTLLSLLQVDSSFDGNMSPLMMAIQRSASTLAKSYANSEMLLEYPDFVWKD